MNVSESKFRQILREEARRVLREVGDTTLSPEPAGGTAAASKSWTDVDTALGQLVKAAGADPELAAGPQQIIIKAKAGWAGCRTSASPKSIEVYNSFSTNRTQSPGAQLAGALLLLSSTPPGTVNPPIGAFTSGLFDTDTTAIIKILNDTGPRLVPKMVTHLTPALPTSAPTTPAKVGTPYTVLKGESISLIAQKKYNPPVPLSKASMDMYKKIAADNGVDQNTFVITPGQSLKLPQTLTGTTGTHTLKSG